MEFMPASNVSAICRDGRRTTFRAFGHHSSNESSACPILELPQWVTSRPLLLQDEKAGCVERGSMEHRSEDKILQYRSRTTWRSARQGLLSASQRPDIIVGSPPEWGGTLFNWAPEE